MSGHDSTAVTPPRSPISHPPSTPSRSKRALKDLDALRGAPESQPGQILPSWRSQENSGALGNACDSPSPARDGRLTKKAKVELTPRSYQSYLYEIAKRRSVIAVLPTGSGKTLVAAMLIQHVLDMHQGQHAQRSPPDVFKPPTQPTPLPGNEHTSERKVILFLVNLVPLVHQQATFIEEHTNARVGRLFGGVGVDTRDEAQWAHMTKQGTYDVIVATAQCVLDGLIHGFFSIRDIQLLIFDEAHHASLVHPYRRIMNCYWDTHPKQRPHIFGMTASPLKSGASFEHATQTLERTLDAIILTAPEAHREELTRAVSRPQELVVEFNPAPLSSPSRFTKFIESEFGAMPGCKRLLARIDEVTAEYGVLMADLVWMTSSKDIRAASRELQDYRPSAESDYELLNYEWRLQHAFDADLSHANLPATAITLSSLKANHSPTDVVDESQAPDLAADAAWQKLSEEIELDKEFLEVLDAVILPDRLEVTRDNATPKIIALVEVLRSLRMDGRLSSDFCGIIFVSRRETAMALNELIKRVPQLDFLHPECLIGHDADARLGMSWQDQSKCLARFRRRDPTNLLIATSVLEEGLDISPCNVIIRFDLFHTHIQFVQSRGRARHQDSQYIILVERGNAKLSKLLVAVTRAEHEMQTWLHNLPDDRELPTDALATSSRGALDDGEEELNAMEAKVHLDERSTGARLHPADCLGVLSYYVAILRTDDYSPSAPVYAFDRGLNGVSATVHLPANARLRVVHGPACKSKRVARRFAAFEACRHLRALGVLDDHLVPRVHRPQMDFQPFEKTVHGKVMGTRFREIRLTIPPPRVFCRLPQKTSNEQFLVHATLLNLSSLASEPKPRDLLLITFEPLPKLPELPLHLEHGACVLPESAGSVPILLTPSQLFLCRKYTALAFALMTRKKQPSAALTFFILPLLSGRRHSEDSALSIDWPEVKHLVDSNLRPVALTTFLDQDEIQAANEILRDRVITRGMDVRCAAPLHVLDVDTFDDLTFERIEEVRRTYRRAFSGPPQEQDVTCLRPDSPSQQYYGGEALIITARRLPRFDNYLSPLPNEGRRRTAYARNHYLVRAACWLHPISASCHRAISFVPSILAHVEHLLRVHELNDRLFASSLDVSMLQVATSAPSAGRDFDYQKLEFLGDAFFKIAGSCYVFSRTITQNEGELHVSRLKVISNANLVRKAVQRGIWQACQVSSFSRKGWSPVAHQVLTFNGGAKVSEKLLADVVEACMGSALMLGGETLCLSVMSQLGLWPEDYKMLSDMHGNWDKQRSKTVPSGGNEPERINKRALEKLENLLQYRFSEPELALEALMHPSLIASDLPSYQRLEFLGDAVVDFLVVDHLQNSYGELDEGALTLLKGNAVSNAAFGALCEAIGLHHFLQHSDATLARAAFEYATQAAKSRAEQEAKEAKDRRQYWWHLSPPKAMADICESIMGAVFTDSHFNLEVAKSLFDRLFLPFFKQYVRPETVVIHSTAALSTILQQLGCRNYSLELTEAELYAQKSFKRIDLRYDAPEPSVGLRCRVVFHGMLLGEGLGVGRQQAQTEAAKAATELLDREGKALLQRCDCREESARVRQATRQHRDAAREGNSSCGSEEGELESDTEGKSQEDGEQDVNVAAGHASAPVTSNDIFSDRQEDAMDTLA
ncbi:hypothetical protein IE81DRAFT_177515 [Ceraceosorus guamensis]|uniref:P-loop containing nucleoside triphosphate hydrolase protein n=1 Tax=Ceraceosorus guamensis TaxID=1522189 RepID=A0A316VV62_9BASI|nr:hypothetical protein IE81DRAFT_177515 [Ceraceosorus guamensis]PWN41332.1 hypothetical protein IE81DRAFT_177515 [Ceraceosorus guamensis]